MIYYFSGSGNSKWVAEQLAEATKDKTVNMAQYIQGKQLPTKEELGDVVGVVFPIHAWDIPTPVMHFLYDLNFSLYTYSYVVVTCGDDVGKCLKRLDGFYFMHAIWSVQMPNTYIPMFPLDNDEITQAKIDKARNETIPAIAQEVLWRNSARLVHEGKYAWLKTFVIHRLFETFIVSPKGFHIEGECNGCGTCVNACPMGNIRLVDKAPQWGENCVHCMACVHQCPRGIVQYRKATQKKGRYHIKDYLKKYTL